MESCHPFWNSFKRITAINIESSGHLSISEQINDRVFCYLPPPDRILKMNVLCISYHKDCSCCSEHNIIVNKNIK